MIFHVCSHWGDIEIESEGNDQCRIRYFKLTPRERDALDLYLASLNDGKLAYHRLSGRGDILVPKSVVEVGAALGEHLHEENAVITAVRFTSGRVKAKRGGIRGLIGGLFSKKSTPKDKGLVPEVVEKPEAAVQTPVPRRGCPMPTLTDLREQKAADVVRKFLVGQQIEDFENRRAFLTRGCDTGHLYRVTSRWAPSVEEYGVLYDLDEGRRLCASNLTMPPSEEVLSMKFAVEIMEREFLNQPHESDGIA